MHGRKVSEHPCVYCCLCFKSLIDSNDRIMFEDMNKLPNGKYEDVCLACATAEKEHMESKGDK